MNICDSEVILSILSGYGYEYTHVLSEATCVILNCCSVREIGHEKALERIRELEKYSVHMLSLLLLDVCPRNLTSLFRNMSTSATCHTPYIIQIYSRSLESAYSEAVDTSACKR